MGLIEMFYKPILQEAHMLLFQSLLYLFSKLMLDEMSHEPIPQWERVLLSQFVPLCYLAPRRTDDFSPVVFGGASTPGSSELKAPDHLTRKCI